MSLLVHTLLALCPLGLTLRQGHRQTHHQRTLCTLAAAQQALNTAQRDAVLSPLNAASLCVAGPGSGKTKVLTTRIAHLIRNHKQAPSSILAITFTNKAAREMQTRLTTILGEVDAHSVTVCTFHAFCSKLLRSAGKQHLAELGIDGEYVIYDQDDCLKIVKELMKEAEIADEFVKPNALLSALNSIREARAMALTDAAANGEYKEALSTFSKANRAALKILESFEKKLRASNALDFEDLLLQGYALLRRPEVSEQTQARYRHVLVDEAQDSSVPQYEIVRLLSPAALLGRDGAPPRSLFAVGDANQAIYSWRGARKENMEKMMDEYSGKITRLGLLQNYRCSPTIISVANTLLGTHATTARDGAAAQKHEPVRIITCEDDMQQAKCVATLLKSLGDKTALGGKTSKREIAVMYRTNAQSRVLEQVMVEQGVKYVLLGGRRFYDRKEIRDALAFLRILFNPYDRSSAQRILETFGLGVGPKTLSTFFSWLDATADRAVAAASEDEGGGGGGRTAASILTHFEALLGDTEAAARVAPQPVELTKREEKSLLSFGEQLLALRARARTESLPKLVRHIVETFLTPDFLLKASRGKEEAEDRQENLDELLKATQKYDLKGEEEEGCLESGALRQFLEEAALLSEDVGASEIEREGPRDDAVFLLTIHASKGLEFDTVFLTGVEEGVLPLTRTSEDRDLKNKDSDAVGEERRLAFVAVTRAKSLLFLTLRQRTLQFAPNGPAKVASSAPSRFLDKLLSLPADTVVKLKWAPK